MKLLNKTLKPFALYSLLILALSVPVYFFIINFIWKNELDKHHHVVKKKIEREMNSLQLDDSSMVQLLALWNRAQPGTLLYPAKDSRVINDSISTTLRYDIHHEDIEQFRSLTSTIMIHNKPFILLVETNMEEFYETLIIIVFATLLFFSLLLAGFIILNRRLSFIIWKPFYNTIHQLRSFNLDGKQTINLQGSDIQEFEELNDALTKLTERNIAAFKQQKEFTENASHELQTPLALLKSKIDLLLQDNTLTEEQSERIASLDIPLSKVSRINKNLLLLAKLENKQFAAKEKSQLGQIVSESICLLEDHYKAKQITISARIEEEVLIDANLSLLEILITNLLLNAIRHNAVGGKICIHLANNALVIANSGSHTLDAETLFKRFINSSGEAPSSGLGLAIVKEICNTHNWTVKYIFKDQLHTFSVHF